MSKTKIENLTVKIEPDNDPQNPREDDNASHMICWHRRYSLGDEKLSKEHTDPEAFMAALAEQFEPEELQPELAGGQSRTNEENWEVAKRRAVILPLYLLDHSGLSISCRPFSCPWDSGQVGYAYMTLDDARRNWMLPEATFDTLLAGWAENEGKQITLREATEGLIRAEVSEYDQYLTGDVWGYIIEDEKGNHLDSCCGFFGREYCETEAREAAKHCLKQIAVEKIEREAMECRDIVTA